MILRNFFREMRNVSRETRLVSRETRREVVTYFWAVLYNCDSQWFWYQSMFICTDSLLLKILVDISSYYRFLRFYSSLCLLLRGSFDWKHMPNTLHSIFINWNSPKPVIILFRVRTPYFVFSTLLSMFGNVIKQHLSCLICCFKNHNFWF